MAHKERCGVGERRIGVSGTVLQNTLKGELGVGSPRELTMVHTIYFYFFNFMVRLYNIFDY